jgi:hypothetical protein
VTRHATRCPHCDRLTRTSGGGRCPNCAGWKTDIVPVQAPVARETVRDVFINILAAAAKMGMLLVPGGGLVAIAVVEFDIGLLMATALVAGLILLPIGLSIALSGWQ